MKRFEVIAALLVLLVLVGTPVSVFAFQAVSSSTAECKTIIMRTYENGNPTPAETHVKKGQKVCLRLTSHDVTHGFLISDLGVDAGEIHAGKWTKVEFVPQEAGTFNFVCTLRCSPLHSRVRGAIVVED